MATPRILIVEGETVAAADVQRALTELGYGVAGVTADGGEAVRLAGARPPALVLMDLRLRGMVDSLDAARDLRERFGLPVVFLADESDPQRLSRALAAEPFGYVRCPYTDAFLGCAIEVALHRHAVESALDAQERELGDGLARIDAMLNVAEGGITIEDDAGRVWRANPRLCAMFGITKPPAQLLKTEAAALRRLIAQRFHEPARFIQRTEELVHERRPAVRERWKLADGRHLEFNFVPCMSGKRFLGQFWVFLPLIEPAPSDDKPE